MIALCREHADKADHGSFSNAQIREMKQHGRANAESVAGRFDWLRRDLFVVAGGNFYFDIPTIATIAGHKCMWFEKDEDGHMLLSVRMPTLMGVTRSSLSRNYWTSTTAVSEILSPPHGRLLEVKYADGDRFRVEFRGISSAGEFAERYPYFNMASILPVIASGLVSDGVVNVVEVSGRIAGVVDFDSEGTRAGGVTVTGSVVGQGNSAIEVAVPWMVERRLYPPLDWGQWKSSHARRLS